MNIVHPIVLVRPDLPHPEIVEPLRRACRIAADWWEQCGIYVPPAAVKVLTLPHTIGLDQPDPWPQTWDAVVQRDPLGLGDARWKPEHRYLVVLAGWCDPWWIGWGGNPLALVGDWAIERLLSRGSAEALVDDYQATAVIAHEIGHVLGYDHDFTSAPPSIMSYRWDLFPNLRLGNPPPLGAGGGAHGCALGKPA